MKMPRGVQVLRYSAGQVYKPHMDANHRMATVLLYLTGVPLVPLLCWYPALSIESLTCQCSVLVHRMATALLYLTGVPLLKCVAGFVIIVASSASPVCPCCHFLAGALLYRKSSDGHR